MKKFRNIGNPIYSSIAVVVFIIVWEIFTRAKNIKEYILPAPSAILNEFITSGDLLLHHSMVTMTETVLGFILGLVLAILLSLLMSSFKLFRSIFYPFMFLSQTIPIIVVAPLITVWLDSALYQN